MKVPPREALMRLALVSIVALLLSSGCNNPFAPDRAIILPVTQIEAPPSVSSGTPFFVRFTVESGGCRRFVRGETTQSSSRLTFVARGRDGSGPNVLCTADIRSDVVLVEVTPPFSDPFTIVATQPSGSPTTVDVQVQ
jgi:hypothetical protein